MNAKITPENIADLPPELVRQLAGQGPQRSNSITQKLIALVEAATEPLNTDQLLIGMYRAHGKILKRANVRSLMYGAIMRGYVTKLDSDVFGPAARKSPT